MKNRDMEKNCINCKNEVKYKCERCNVLYCDECAIKDDFQCMSCSPPNIVLIKKSVCGYEPCDVEQNQLITKKIEDSIKNATDKKRPRRSDEKYWTGTREFDHIAYETDLENYIYELESFL
jgi:hypothetical protein